MDLYSKKVEYDKIRDYHRRHTKMRVFARYNREVDDVWYDEACRAVRQGIVEQVGETLFQHPVFRYDGVLVTTSKKRNFITTALPPDEETRAAIALKKQQEAQAEKKARTQMRDMLHSFPARLDKLFRNAETLAEVAEKCGLPQVSGLKHIVEQLDVMLKEL